MSDAFSLTPWQAEGFLESRGDRLVMDGVDLVALAEAEGTPIYVYSARRIRENAEGLRAAFQARHANTTVAYASKACSLMAVLRLIGEAGCALEVNSEGELWKARRAGFKDEAIVLNGVAKARSEIAAAIDPPIKAINVDSLFELERIRDVAAAANKRANVALRLVPELESGTAPGTETGSSRTKFGMTVDQLGPALEILRAGKAQLNLVGLHVHIGSQVTDRASYAEAGRFIAAQAREVEGALGERLACINVGGGFPVDYVKYHDQSRAIGYYRSGTELEDFAEALLMPVHQALGDAVEIITEPGRRLVSDAAVLLARVENVKQRGQETWLYLDAGYHTLLETFAYHWYFHALTANRAEDAETGLFRLVGPLCDNGDSFYDVDGEALMRRLMTEAPGLASEAATLRAHLVRLPSFRELPAATGPGDLIAFLDTGAYSQDQLYAVNGRGRPKVLMIGEDGTPRVIRTADSFDDMLLNEVD
jgi:diaminopimelate decarboxylase